MSWDEYKKYREDLKKKKEKLNIDLPTVGAVKNPAEKYTKDYKAPVTNKVKNSTSNIRIANKEETKNTKTYNPLWQQVQNIASGTGKISTNLWLSLKNGIKSSQQTIGRNLSNQLADRADLVNNMQNRVLQGRLEERPEKKEKINNLMNNPIVSGDKIRQHTKEVNEKFNTQKEANLAKIQENAKSIDNPVAKYLAEKTAPAIGQMLPGLVGGPMGTLYFTTSAAGNYYDDAKQRGMSEDQATMYSGIMGIIEGSLESIGAKLTTNVGKQLLKKNIKGALVSYGLDVGENFLEESIVEPISELTVTTVAGKEKADWSNIGKRMLESGIDGAITSLITGGASGAIGLATSKAQENAKSKTAQKWINEAQKIVDKNNTQNLQQNAPIEQNNISTQQINQENNKVAQNRISEPINNNQQNLANNQETLYNNITLGETKNVPIEEILPLQTSGGYRTQSEMANLKEDIAKNGIQNPIELAKRNDGTIEIENGNHRLMIAKELGLKEVPIKFVEGWENVGKNVDKTESKFVENWEKSYDRNNRNGATINKYNVRDGIIEGDGANNRNEFENGTTTERNDIVPNKIQTYNDRPSSSATSEQSIKELEEPSSFSMQDNKDLSYQGNNRASGKAYGKNITVDKMTTEVEKIKEKYSKVIDSKDNEAIAQINKVKDNPDAEITIYRGSPNGEINVGDWVFLTRERAQDYTRTKITKTPIPGYSVGELKVKARDVDWTGKNLEFVYNPQSIDNPDIRYSLPTKKQTTPPVHNTVSANLPLSENTKVRKHYKSIIESPYINNDARKISRELMGTDTYVPESNEKQLERANKTIETAIELNGRAGVDAELNSLLTRAMTKGNIKADDIAVGERLIQYYSKIGDKAKLQDAIQATAMAGTTAGQTVQAMSLLNHQTPEGHAVWLQRSVEKMNNDLKEQRGSKNKEAEQFTLTQDMLEKITNSKDDVELQKNLNEVYSELGQQVSKTTMGKIDSWRYFAMLANPRTHIRNIVGNFAMGKTQQMKNKLAGVIEGVASKINPNIERTHTIVPASKEIKNFAKNDIVNVADRLGLNQNKYNPKNRIEGNMRTFKSDLMENTVGKLFEFNDKALEAEDGWGLKAGYKKALSEYMTANKLTPENITDKQLAKARNYAVEQAKEATFHQQCQLASLINQLSKKNKFAKATTDAILPFVKTPMNVAKAGASYSPVGLAKSIVYDTVQLRKGNINANQYIDNISKGLTGTGIALIGYALAKSGILKASGSDDDKKEQFEENQGKQTYAIQIGDNTYSLDWLSPTGIPLFIGAEIWEMNLNKEKNSASSTDEDSTYNQILNSGTNLLNAMANAMNPMTEMSMLSGLTSALQSYEQGSAKMLASMTTNAGKSYINQFIPTALGQIAKTTDKYERSTSSTKQGVLSRAVDSAKNQIMSKVPGLRQKLPTKTDVWGNDLKQADNIGQRALENAVLPYTRKSVSTNEVDKELTRLYDETGESSVLPGILDKNITIDGEKYRFTADEYASYKKQYGKESFKMFSNVVRSTSYKNMSDEKRQEVIEKIYTYNKELIKKDYADKNNKKFEPSTMMKTIDDIQKNSGNVANYFIYEADTKNMKADKDKDGDSINGSLSGKIAYYIMNNKQFSDADKNAFLKNMTSSENYQTIDDLKDLDNKESIYKYYFKLPKESKESFKSAVKVVKNQSEYVKFKEQEFTSDKKNDGTLKGKSISGSKKRKVYNYVNNSNASYTDRLYMIGTEYELNKSEKSTLMKYINSLNITSTEKYNIIKTLKGSTEYKDGSIRY